MTHSIDSLDGMTPDEIATAYDEGRLDGLLGAPPEDVAVLDKAHTGHALNLDDVRHLATLGRHDLINDAHRDGRIAYTHDTQEN